MPDERIWTFGLHFLRAPGRTWSCSKWSHGGRVSADIADFVNTEYWHGPTQGVEARLRMEIRISHATQTRRRSVRNGDSVVRSSTPDGSESCLGQSQTQQRMRRVSIETEATGAKVRLRQLSGPGAVGVVLLQPAGRVPSSIGMSGFLPETG